MAELPPKEQIKEELTELERARRLQAQRKTDEKKLYRPLIKIMKEVIDRLGKLELDVPIYKIARMEIAGIFSQKRHVRMRKSILNFLKRTNKYRKMYWEFQKSTKMTFNKEMQKTGSYAPGLKEYESLRTQLYKSILDENSNVWVLSYNNYLPTIREHSTKKGRKPQNGTGLFAAVDTKLKRSMRQIKKKQVQLVIEAQDLLEDLETSMKNPEKQWRIWREQKTPSKSKEPPHRPKR